jgi:SAM-dependent methyltransferase
MYEGRQQRIQEFVDWASKHITGDEKGQAQIFLERLFLAFGQKGCLDVGGSPEYRIRRAAEDGGGTAFADYVWKPHVLIEMKKRGADLSRHYRQAFDYWTRLVPNRPRYVVLSNFDSFSVYDFDKQIDAPVDTVALSELPKRWGPLAFLFPTNEKPTFDNDRVAVTREAADKLALCFRKLVIRKVPRPLAQRFILQTLVALFAEDIGLLPKYLMGKLIEECREPQDSYDILGGLFDAMNSRAPRSGGRYKDVRYFNGGLFSEPARVELHPDELAQLREAARSDWSKVDPHIFGALFQDSMEAEERHAYGAHYTSPVDILKIVGPTIVKPWKATIEEAKTPRKLLDLFERLSTLQVLDPACGSGNFLYLAYREMKRLEGTIRRRLREEFPATQAPLIHVNARQFHGLDINPFAIELAKVGMMIGRKLAIDELGFGDEATLPFDNLDANFIVTDALITRTPDGGAIQTPWPKADVIIGNPPFLGAKRLKPEHGADYANALRKLYPEVPGMADFCVYWIRRTHDHLPECTKSDPFAGRAGLVGTQNVRNNQSRVGGLDHVVKTGTIVEAVDNQPWSGDAAVHVSITNWMKTQNAAILPKKRLLWQKLELTVPAKRKTGMRADKDCELTVHTGDALNSSLSLGTDVSSRIALNCNKAPKRCFQGKIPGYEGFMLTAKDVADLGGTCEVVVPYLTGRELLDEFRIDRWAIDFRNMDMAAASAHRAAFARCRETVLPAVRATLQDAEDRRSDMVSAREEHLRRWWQFWNRRDELNTALSGMRRYIACSRVTRRPIMVFLGTQICPSDLIQVFAFDDDYSFGILQSSLHSQWFRTSSRLKVESDSRYSVRAVFETFPWPQNPRPAAVQRVAETARAVRAVRSDLLRSGGGLRDLYRLLDLPGNHPLRAVHAALDAAVMAAYGFSQTADPLSQILSLNHDVARAETAGHQVTPPGIPFVSGNTGDLTSEDFYNP